MNVWNFTRKRLVPINVRKYAINWNEESCSKPQTLAKRLLKPYWHYYTVLEEWRIPSSLFRIDFLNINLKIAIEVNPIQHREFNPFFHRTRTGFYRQLKSDMDKISYLEYNNFQVLELNEEDLERFSPTYIEKTFGISII